MKSLVQEQMKRYCLQSLCYLESKGFFMIAYDEAETQIAPVEHLGFVDANQLTPREIIAKEAWELISNRSHITQPEVGKLEYQDNSRTALMEALTASGHLSKVTLSGSLEEIEAQMVGRLLNGWDDNLPEHEKDRRFAELCNVLYGQRVRRSIVGGELPENTAILEISDYPEPLTGTNIGYRDKNKKGMVRSTHLERRSDGQYDLIIEQVSRSNATGESTANFLEACGTQPFSGHIPSDLAALEMPLLYNTYDYADGVVDVMRLLDNHQGMGVLYGDKGTAKTKHVHYDDLRSESAWRETEIESFTNDLAKLEQQLDGYVKKGQMTHRERLHNFNGEIERMLAAICTLKPAYAATTFGERAAPVFAKAAIMVAKGQGIQVKQLLNETLHLRDAVTFCGATITVEEANELGIKVSSIDKLLGKGKNNWTWKNGVCVVESCPTRPGNTLVGPCSVCKKCQAKFDNGQDPTKQARLPKIARKRGEHSFISKQESNRRVGRTALKSRITRSRGDA